MPHLLTNRSRTFPQPPSWPLPKIRANRYGALMIEVLEVTAGCIFVAGSICFLPRYSKSLLLFDRGCSLFIFGSILYCVLCTVTFLEALTLKGAAAVEVWENLMYLAGSSMYLVGSILYMPAEAQFENLVENLNPHAAKVLSLSQFCEYFGVPESQHLGTELFISGSVLHVFAAFTNAWNQQRFDQWSNRLLSAVTSLYMGGSILFGIGAIAFLPTLGCSEELVGLGAWCFIGGSTLFLTGGALSLWRSAWLLGLEEEDDVDSAWAKAGSSCLGGDCERTLLVRNS